MPVAGTAAEAASVEDIATVAVDIADTAAVAVGTADTAVGIAAVVEKSWSSSALRETKCVDAQDFSTKV
ncbi:hypothetical protein MCC02031_02260 [Bifidobacteriaceae bacterium MCC02031]|nr:hypothetical protein MCC02031_02260 [Bifidobacteriaceae bacterium MCC02031]